MKSESWSEKRVEGQPIVPILGTMNFGGRTKEKDAQAIVSRALERQVPLLDTANVYGDGESERIVGRVLSHLPTLQRPAIATKVGLLRQGRGPEGLSRGRVVDGAKESLDRLKVDKIDLYYLHAPDRTTPLDETLDGVAELLSAGLIGKFGISNYASWEILDIQQRCHSRGIPGPAVSQVLYNALIRQLDVEYFAFTVRHPVHTTVYNPLAGGLLSGRYLPGASVPAGSRFANNKMYQRRYFSPQMLSFAQDLANDAGALGLSLVEASYTFLSQCPGVDSVLLGPANQSQLDVALDALSLSVSSELRERFDARYLAFQGTDARYAR